MRKLLAIAGALALAGCTTTGTLTASKDFGYAQLGFKALEQSALTCISQNVKLCTANHDAIIAAADAGQAAETAGYTAQQAHNQPALIQATTDLAAAITALQKLGITQ